MPTRVLVLAFDTNSITGMRITFAYTDNTNFPSLGSRAINISVSSAANSQDFQDAAITAINADAVTNGYTLSDGIIWLTSIPSLTRSFNNTPGRSIVTGTGATGFQVSSTRDSHVSYSPKIVTTATIAGGQDGYVVLEIAATNSATAGDWKEIGRVENGQALSLALTLQSVQPVGSPLNGVVPAGWYAKLRSVNVTGTPTFTSVSGQEVLL